MQTKHQIHKTKTNDYSFCIRCGLNNKSIERNLCVKNLTRYGWHNPRPYNFLTLTELKSKKLPVPNKPDALLLNNHNHHYYPLYETTRFIKCENPEQFNLTVSENTVWWWDTFRRIKDAKQLYVAVQTMAHKNANDCLVFPFGKLRLLFTDQLEYYAVCFDCFATYEQMQWSGHSKGASDWHAKANDFLYKHQKEKGWCQFCDEVFGNGGWHIGNDASF